jgi:hypothetical protein
MLAFVWEKGELRSDKVIPTGIEVLSSNSSKTERQSSHPTTTLMAQ